MEVHIVAIPKQFIKKIHSSKFQSDIKKYFVNITNNSKKCRNFDSAF